MGARPQSTMSEDDGQQSPITTYGHIDINSISTGQQVDPRIFNVFGATPAGQQDDYILGGNSSGRTFGDKMNYSLGLSYLAGIGLMGTYGAFEGVTNKAVRGKSLKMKMNAVMNGSGLRGAKAGNGLGAMTLFYCCGESFITWVRKTDGPENVIEVNSGRKDVTSSWGARCWCRRTYGSWKRVWTRTANLILPSPFIYSILAWSIT